MISKAKQQKKKMRKNQSHSRYSATAGPACVYFLSNRKGNLHLNNAVKHQALPSVNEKREEVAALVHATFVKASSVAFELEVVSRVVLTVVAALLEVASVAAVGSSLLSP